MVSHRPFYNPLQHMTEQIKTHGCVSAAKKDMRHTLELFTGTIISAPHISKTTGPIFTKFTYLCSTYTQPYIPNFKEIRLVVCEICTPENRLMFFVFFFFAQN